MSKWQVILIILLMIGISSCNKESDKELIEYPITLTSYLISGSEIKVYTKDGEITLPNLKNKIIQRYKNNLTNLESVEIQGKVTATYLTENTIELTIDKIKEEKVRIVYENDVLIYWEKQDTSGMPVFSTFDIADILKYQPLFYEEFDVPKVTGYNKAAMYKECFYVLKNNGELKIPMFDYMHRSELGLPSIFGINNEFNESCLSLIGNNDTIVIQEYFIEMK